MEFVRQVMLGEGVVGATLAKSIYAPDGRLLVNAGVVLTPSLVEALRARGYGWVVVQDGLLDDVIIDDALCEETRAMAASAVAGMFERTVPGKKGRGERIIAAVERMLDELWSQPEVVFSISAIRCHEGYLFWHSVDVATVSLLVAMASGYDRVKMRELGVGALLHDIGMVKVPVEILRAPRSLTNQEFERVKLHTTLGYRIITENKEFSYIAAHAALEHHERLDGSGYPRGLRGDKILDIGRIVGVADVFCAMTEDRPHRKRVHPHEAIRYLRASAARFDQRFVRRLALRMASYPNGTFVRLSTGDFGVVVRQDKRDGERPVVRLLADGRNRPVEPVEIALADMPEVQVSLVADTVPEELERVLELRLLGQRGVSGTPNRVDGGD